MIGHGDITPLRKSDPGPCFPWEELAMSGIGAWYDKDTLKKYLAKFANEALPSKLERVNQLNKYGYDVSSAASETGYKDLIRAFQMHFHQNHSDSYGEVDIETAAILYALVEKYKK